MTIYAYPDYRAILAVQYHFLLHGESGGFSQSDWIICFTLIIIYNINTCRGQYGEIFCPKQKVLPEL